MSKIIPKEFIKSHSILLTETGRHANSSCWTIKILPSSFYTYCA